MGKAEKVATLPEHKCILSTKLPFIPRTHNTIGVIRSSYEVKYAYLTRPFINQFNLKALRKCFFMKGMTHL